MSDAHIAQIEAMLKQRYFAMIPQLQVNWQPEQHERNRISRSLAAFAIEKLADTTSAASAKTGWPASAVRPSALSSNRFISSRL